MTAQEPCEPLDGDFRFFRDFVDGRRGEILDAALVVFDRHGYDAGTMREIAETVGVSEPALYRHFTGKEALFSELVTLAGERFVREARGVMMSYFDPADLPGSLTAVMLDRRHAVLRFMPLARVLISVAGHRCKFRDLLSTHLAMPMRGALLELVPIVDAARGITSTPEETARRVRAFMALFIGYHVTAIMLRDDDPAPIVAAMLRVMGWE